MLTTNTTTERLTSITDNRWATHLTTGWSIYKPGVGLLASGLTEQDVRKRFHLS